jgi:hypothetical protein
VVDGGIRRGAAAARSRAVFEWTPDGAFLVQRARTEPLDFEPPPEWAANNPLPLVMVFGLDEPSGTFGVLYADARGVFRVYRATLHGGEWTIWGQAGPEFHQRFTARIGPDGSAITGAWERSRDGSAWEHDFAVSYAKLT